MDRADGREAGLPHGLAAGSTSACRSTSCWCSPQISIPSSLADEAFLRRLGSKVCFRPVSAPQYRRSGRTSARNAERTCTPDTVEHVIVELHAVQGKPMLPCHPRDLIGMALDRSGYFGGDAGHHVDSVEWAWNNYFVEEKSE